MLVAEIEKNSERRSMDKPYVFPKTQLTEIKFSDNEHGFKISCMCKTIYKLTIIKQ